MAAVNTRLRGLGSLALATLAFFTSSLPIAAQNDPQGPSRSQRQIEDSEKLRLLRENWQLAKKAEDRKDYKTAIACYNTVLRIDPRNKLTHTRLGWAYEKLGDKQSAYRAYKDAFIIPIGERGSPSSDLLALCRFGELCLESGDTANAKIVYERFARFSKWPREMLAQPTPHGPSDNAMRAHSYLVVASDKRYKGTENEEIALVFADQALALFPNDWIALHMKGMILHRLRDKEGAKTAFGKVMKLAPQSAYSGLREQAKRFRLTSGKSSVTSHPDGRTEYRTLIIYPDGTKEESVRITPRKGD